MSREETMQAVDQSLDRMAALNAKYAELAIFKMRDCYNCGLEFKGTGKTCCHSCERELYE